MGSRLTRFEFKAGENEQIETTIRVSEEPRSIIHGIVVNTFDKFIENAVVKLFEVENPCDPCSLKSISHTFTDENGQFLFGPLMPGRHYVIKIWVNDIKVRNLVICPNKNDDRRDCEYRDSEEEVNDSLVEYQEPVDKRGDLHAKTEDKKNKENEEIAGMAGAEERKNRSSAVPGGTNQGRKRNVVRRQRQS